MDSADDGAGGRSLPNQRYGGRATAIGSARRRIGPAGAARRGAVDSSARTGRNRSRSWPSAWCRSGPSGQTTACPPVGPTQPPAWDALTKRRSVRFRRTRKALFGARDIRVRSVATSASCHRVPTDATGAGHGGPVAAGPLGLAAEPPRSDPHRAPVLTDEPRERPTVHTPEWTEVQQSDPGVTLLALLAFFVESDLFVHRPDGQSREPVLLGQLISGKELGVGQ